MKEWEKEKTREKREFKEEGMVQYWIGKSRVENRADKVDQRGGEER